MVGIYTFPEIAALRGTVFLEPVVEVGQVSLHLPILVSLQQVRSLQDQFFNPATEE
jgi:hypothetical protein